jgi:two-component system response regulator GlrR
LVDHFLRIFSKEMKKEVKGLSLSALHRLMLHDWPGNVRELENTIEYAIAMTRQEIITEEYILQTKEVLRKDPLRPLKEARDDYEKNYIIQLLESCKGNVSMAAKMAGKYRADFYDLLKKHNLKIENFKKPE